jgi:hypothetical protein
VLVQAIEHEFHCAGGVGNEASLKVFFKHAYENRLEKQA